jgi:4a-hydroxytetrahydrobiopterin dehydratase
MNKIWIEKDDYLRAELKFKNFEEAMEFMSKCVPLISAQNHHPEWSNVYNVVYILLTTHDSGNTITEKDRRLAQAIEELYWQIQL